MARGAPGGARSASSDANRAGRQESSAGPRGPGRAPRRRSSCTRRSPPLRGRTSHNETSRATGTSPRTRGLHPRARTPTTRRPRASPTSPSLRSEPSLASLLRSGLTRLAASGNTPLRPAPRNQDSRTGRSGPKATSETRSPGRRSVESAQRETRQRVTAVARRKAPLGGGYLEICRKSGLFGPLRALQKRIFW